MPTEIERKFLVVSDEWRASVTHSRRLKQGYLFKSPDGSLRVRRWRGGATIALKGPRRGIVREEFEYAIPREDADRLLRRYCAQPLLEKVRHWVAYGGMTWEVDVYCGLARDLVTAEIELDHADQVFSVPRWVGAEITHDPSYSNAAIAGRLARKLETPPPKPDRRPVETVITPAT